MVTQEQVNATKLAMRITTDAFDMEILGLLQAAELDLGIAGVEIPEETNAIVLLAKTTYVQMHFGTPDNFDRLKQSYDEQKAQLATCTGYTDWLVNHG